MMLTSWRWYSSVLCLHHYDLSAFRHYWAWSCNLWGTGYCWAALRISDSVRCGEIYGRMLLEESLSHFNASILTPGFLCFRGFTSKRFWIGFLFWSTQFCVLYWFKRSGKKRMEMCYWISIWRCKAQIKNQNLRMRFSSNPNQNVRE